MQHFDIGFFFFKAACFCMRANTSSLPEVQVHQSKNTRPHFYFLTVASRRAFVSHRETRKMATYSTTFV